jgi:hypothetical protein
MFRYNVNTVFMPVALDVQAMGIIAATAIANAFRRSGVLQGRGDVVHTVIVLLLDFKSCHSPYVNVKIGNSAQI